MSYFATNTVRSNEPLSIQRRRIDEANKANLHTIITEQKHKENIAQWENTVTEKQNKNITKSLINSIKQQQGIQLQQRQQKLAQLLTADDLQYRSELTSLEQSQTDRLNEKLQYARQLKADREQRRQQYVRQQYELLYELNCDELRTIDSEHYRLYIAEQQKQQQVENAKLKQQKLEQDKLWQQQYEQELLEKLQYDQNLVQQRKTAILENRNIIQQQLQEKQLMKQQQLQRIQADKQAMNAQIAADNATAAEQQRLTNERNALLRRQIAAYNERLERERLAELAQRKENERYEIDQKIAQYKQDTAAKNEHARQLYNDMNSYRQYLQDQKIQQQQTERQIEYMVQQEMNKYYAQRDAQYEREKAARNALLQDVLQQRAQQVNDKQTAQQKYEYEQRLLKEQYEQEYANAKQQEQADLQRKYNTMQQRKAELQQQMNELAARKQAETVQVQQQRTAAQQAEREYNELLERMRSNTISNAQRQYGTKR